MIVGSNWGASAEERAMAMAAHALALGDLVMMRKQLLTLKLLAERDTARAGASSR